MAETISVGWQPQVITVVLSAGGDWKPVFSPLVTPAEPIYPDGTTAEARVYAPGTHKLPLDQWEDHLLATWPGTVGDNDIRFSAESEDTDGIPARSYVRLLIKYPGSGGETDDYVWAIGYVRRRD